MTRPTATQIFEWKNRYHELYEVSVGGVDYIFRALTFREYDKLTADDTNTMADIEEIIIPIAVLWPEAINVDRIKAGHVSAIAEEIIDVSGFSSIANAKAILEVKRDESMTFRFNMKAFVLATHPNIREEELDDLTFSQLAAKVAMAERIIAVHQAIAGRSETGVQLDIVDPNELPQSNEADKEQQLKEFQRLQKDRYGPEIGDGNVQGSKFGTAPVGDPIAERLKAALGG